MSIHPTAIIDPSAELDSGVEIQAYSIVEAGVRIGAGTVVGPHAVIGAGTVLGRNNRLYSGAQVGIVPQDLKHIMGSVGKTVIGDDNVIREFVTISSSTVYPDDAHEKVTSVGSSCLLMACSHIAHDCVVGNRVIIANNTALAGHVTIQDRVNVGGLVGIHQFCVIGTMAFIGGMARINKDVLPYMITEGHPARCYGPNTIGLERAGIDKDGIKRIRQMYKSLYRSGLNTTQALEQIEAEIEASPEKDTLVTFIKNSARGICP